MASKAKPITTSAAPDAQQEPRAPELAQQFHGVSAEMLATIVEKVVGISDRNTPAVLKNSGAVLEFLKAAGELRERSGESVYNEVIALLNRPEPKGAIASLHVALSINQQHLIIKG